LPQIECVIICVRRSAATTTEVGMMCKRCLVSGRVQGVYYRATAARRAHELGIRGFARNLSDGRVEIVACGADESVSAFVKWLWIGSSASKVTAIEVTDAAPDPLHARPGFHTS
jgi:acylphosphatase